MTSTWPRPRSLLLRIAGGSVSPPTEWSPRARYDPPVLRGLFLEFRGVLLDDGPLHLEATERVLADLGLKLELRSARAKCTALNDRACFEAALEAAGEAADPARVARLVARKASYYRDRVRQAGYPFAAGAVRLLRSAISRGVPLAMVTSSPRDEVDSALVQEGLARSFKVLLTADELAEPTLTSATFALALDALNSQPPLPDRMIHPHEVVALLASPETLAAAAGAGLATLGVARLCPAEELAAAGWVVASLEGVELLDLEARLSE